MHVVISSVFALSFGFLPFSSLSLFSSHLLLCFGQLSESHFLLGVYTEKVHLQTFVMIL